LNDDLDQLWAENRRLNDVLEWVNSQCPGRCGAVAHFALHKDHPPTVVDLVREVRAEVEPLKTEVERLRAACVELNSALSRIAYALGEPNEMGASAYDVHADPESVVRQVTEWAQRTSRSVTKAEDGLAFTQDWYAARIARLSDLCKQHGCWEEAAAILANGSTGPGDPPTYAQTLADLRAQVRQLTEERGGLQPRARKAEPSRAPFRDGSRVRVTRRDLLYDRISGGNCLGACAVGEILVVVSNRMGRSRMIKVRHPTLGVGFTHASFLEVVDD
jgi:hypothetical protein